MFFPDRAARKWKVNVGNPIDDEWEICSTVDHALYVYLTTNRGSLNIISYLHLQYIPLKLLQIEVLQELMCPRCQREHGDLIHLLWRYPKLHLFWMGVVNILNSNQYTNRPEILYFRHTGFFRVANTH